MQEDTHDVGGNTVAWSDGPFAIVPMWILEAGASAAAVRVFCALAGWYSDRKGESFPRRKTIAGRLDISVDSFDRAIRELRDLGAVSVEERHRDDGSRSSNAYTLHASRQVAAETRRPRRAKPRAEPDPSNQYELELRSSSAPAGAGAEGGRTTQQNLVGYFVDGARARKVDPPGQLNALMGRYVKGLLSDGVSEEDIRAGIDFMLDKGLANPHLLAQCVVEAKLPRKQPRRYGRGVTNAEIEEMRRSGALAEAVDKLNRGDIFDAH